MRRIDAQLDAQQLFHEWSEADVLENIVPERIFMREIGKKGEWGFQDGYTPLVVRVVG